MATYLPLLGPSQIAATGTSVPTGGNTGQALVKNSNTDYDVLWGTVATGSISLTTGVTGILPLANGGSGTATPALVAGTNITITGSWPNQTINSTGGAGGKASYTLTGANTLTQATHSGAHGSWTGGSTAIQTLPSTQALGDYIEVTNDGTVPITFANCTSAAGFKLSALPGETFQAVSNATIWRSLTSRVNNAINALTDGTTITWDTDIGCNASVTLGGNRTLVINNAQDGGVYEFWITQDATGSRTLTLPTNVKKASADSLTLSTAANAVDLMALTYHATKNIFLAAVKLNIA